MRKLTAALLLAAVMIAYFALDALELRGSDGEFQTFFWLLVALIEAPLLVMLALQFEDSPHNNAATAAIAFVAFAGLSPFFAFILLISAMDFMNDGERWGLLFVLLALMFLVGAIARNRCREAPADDARRARSIAVALSLVYVLAAYVAGYACAVELQAERRRSDLIEAR